MKLRVESFKLRVVVLGLQILISAPLLLNGSEWADSAGVDGLCMCQSCVAPKEVAK